MTDFLLQESSLTLLVLIILTRHQRKINEKNLLEREYLVLLHCDQAAAMKIDEEVLAFFAEACRIAGTNQEALHQEAHEVRKALEAAGDEVVRDLTGTDDFTVCWADSGTGIFHLFNASGIVLWACPDCSVMFVSLISFFYITNLHLFFRAAEKSFSGTRRRSFTNYNPYFHILQHIFSICT